MENATKALLIAAGVLFAVIIFGLLFFMYNQITGYYQSKETNLTIEQLSAFNNEYSVYERELTGFELVSLINKAADFNKKNADEGYSNITVEVAIPKDPKESYNGALFGNKNKNVELSFNGKKLDEPSKNDEEKYEDYLTFKRGTFEFIETKKNESGQINYLKYRQKFKD